MFLIVFNNIGGTSMCIKLNEIEFQNRFKNAEKILIYLTKK